jgi:hypothetical protein
MVSRDELHRLVWSEPMTKVAERFKVSGSCMARVCTLLDVPRPARGYWAKLAVGKAPPPEPLPDARPGDPLSWSNDGMLPASPKPRQPPRRRPAAEEKRRQDEDRRRVEQSARESREQLTQIIGRWPQVLEVERFLAGVERRAADLPAEDQALIRDRLRLAHAFLGTQDPLDVFLAWRTPTERYHPVYLDETT